MRPNTVATIVALSAAVDQAGSAIPADFVVAVSAQAVVTGTSTGNLNIQVSNDIGPPVNATTGLPVPTNWSTVATIGTIAIAGAGVYLIPKFDTSYKWIRASFVHTNAASGTISVNLHTFGF